MSPAAPRHSPRDHAAAMRFLPHTARAARLALAAALVGVSCSRSPDYVDQFDEVTVVERRPGSLLPEDSTELDYGWLEAFDRSDIGDEVELDEELFEGRLALALEDLYVELWHDGTEGARGLLEGLRRCDRDARVRFGAPLFVEAGEVDPPSEWALEVRYLESDPDARTAAELLRDQLRESCDAEARELVREAVDRYGMVLRPVPSLPYTEDHGNRIPLVVLLAPAVSNDQVSGLTGPK